jgi:hypothetical protein
MQAAVTFIRSLPALAAVALAALAVAAPAQAVIELPATDEVVELTRRLHRDAHRLEAERRQLRQEATQAARAASAMAEAAEAPVDDPFVLGAEPEPGHAAVPSDRRLPVDYERLWDLEYVLEVCDARVELAEERHDLRAARRQLRLASRELHETARQLRRARRASAARPVDLVTLGRLLERHGFDVSEHPAFGGVAYGSHSPTSAHYRGDAVDVNWSGGDESARLDALYADLLPLERNGVISQLLWRTAGHYDHLHFARPGYYR